MLQPLKPGDRLYLGYDEWLVSKPEAEFIRERGYAIVQGERQPVRFVATWEHVDAVQLKVQGTNSDHQLRNWTRT